MPFVVQLVVRLRASTPPIDSAFKILLQSQNARSCSPNLILSPSIKISVPLPSARCNTSRPTRRASGSVYTTNRFGFQDIYPDVSERAELPCQPHLIAANQDFRPTRGNRKLYALKFLLKIAWYFRDESRVDIARAARTAGPRRRVPPTIYGTNQTFQNS
ncbi:hypothetical protein JAAARDRAFT_290916 [Jaapia argillacea MUCL 33604]|uniref:Uncharacterized protein n=1 Tax=Jaapia argillacea MUCL 33604 TaxID=933084 RepID=A0A067Q194_9AGAM|nr:hypothetical protein JAAARDRAFT_290916 [Jaapia argillacea MUCL 33604]